MLTSTLNHIILAALLALAHYAPVAGFCSIFTVFWFNKSADDDQNPSFRTRLYMLLQLPFLVLLCAFIVIPVIAKIEHNHIITSALSDLSIFISTAILGIVAAVIMLRTGTQIFERTKSKLTQKTALERNKKTDVREINKFLPAPMPPYSINQYIDFKKGTFLGLDEHKKPIYYPAGKTLPHVEVAGTTGSGKGVFIGMLISQNIGQGEAVFVIDPKDDEAWGSGGLRRGYPSNRRFKR